jgi:MbtH protein
MSEEREDDRRYRAVVNDEEQYSIWLADRDLPAGWSDAGKEGTRRECLDWIEEVWTDMRPKSLREALDRDANGASAGRRARLTAHE